MAKRNGNNRPRRRRAGDILNLIVSKISSLSNNPVILVVLILSIAVGVLVKTNPASNPIVTIGKDIAKIKSLKALGDWIQKHVSEVYGLLCFQIPVLASRSYRFSLLIFALIYTCFLPAQPVWEYLVQALTLWAFITSRNVTLRILLIIFIIICYFTEFGFTGILGKPSARSDDASE